VTGEELEVIRQACAGHTVGGAALRKYRVPALLDEIERLRDALGAVFSMIETSPESATVRSAYAREIAREALRGVS